MTQKRTYLPFRFDSILHETFKAVLFSGFNGSTKEVTDKWGTRTGAMWLAKSQIMRDPAQRQWLWVSTWLCQQKSLIPVVQLGAPQSREQIQSGDAFICVLNAIPSLDKAMDECDKMYEQTEANMMAEQHRMME